MKKRKILLFALALFIFISLLNIISSAPIMENIGNKTFIAGESVSFGDDYNLYVNSIDSGANKANLILYKGASTLFQKWFSVGSLLNDPGVITAHVYSITSSPSGGSATLKLTDIMAIGKTSAGDSEPSTSGDTSCIEQWKCSLWRACSNGIQTRNCTDLNNCGTTINKPNITKTCYVQPLPGNPCTENWQCSDWSACMNNLFIRICEDLNNCGTTINKPAESLACDPNIPADPNNPNDPNNPGNNENPNNPGGNNAGSQVTNVYNYNTNPSRINTTYEIFTLSGMQLPDLPFGMDFGPGLIISLIFLLIFLLILLLFYVYISSAFSSLAKKKDFSHPGLSWIPIIGPLIIMSNLANMHWWPIFLLMLVPLKIITLMFLPFSILITMILEYIGFAALLVLTVFSFIWMWKTFNAVNRPGWWVLFNLVPILGSFIFLILLGVAAWSKKELPNQSKNSKTISKNKKK